MKMQISNGQSANKGRLTCLLVDDQRVYRSMLMELMQHHERLVAANGREALELFKEHKPDIVFLDIMLPDMSGLSLLARMKQMNPECFIVMITASKMPEDIEYANQGGASAYICKPYNRQKILGTLDLYRQHQESLANLSPQEKEQARAHCFDQARKLQGELEPPVSVVTALPEIRRKIMASWRWLMVTDDAELAMNVRKYMSQFESTLDVVTTAEMAASKLEHHAYESVFIDADLPENSVTDVALKIRDRNQDIPLIVMMKASWQRENPKWQMLKVESFIFKPVTKSILQGVLESRLHNHLAAMKDAWIA